VGESHGCLARGAQEANSLTGGRRGAVSKTEDRLEESGQAIPAAGNGRVTDEAVASPEKTLPFAAYVPMGALSRYKAPKSTIDPDRSKGWIKRATPIVMAHKVQWYAAMIFSFLGLIIQVWIPKILQNGITNALINKTQPLHNYVELIAVLALATGIFGYISRTNLFKVAYAIEFDLRNIIYEHFTRMSFPFYDRVQSGQLISRANSDIRSVQMYLTFAPMILVQCSIAVVAFAFMLSISVPLAFVAMAAMPFIYLVGVRMRRSLFPVSWIIQARLAEVATVVDENVNGVRVVRSFAAEQQQLRQLATAADRVQWGYIKDADLRARFAPLVQNLSQVGLVLVLLVGGWMVIHENLPVASIVSFNLYLIMMQAPFMMLGMLIMMGQRASASAERIYEILDEQPTIVDRPDAIELVNSQGDVEFDDVSFAYAADSLMSKPGDENDGRRDILRHLNLHLHPGETVAMVGRTGSGKSSVARVLARFYDATGGTVRVDGHDVRDLTLTSLRGNIGVVLDEPFLFSVSIRDNIAYGRPDASMEEVIAAAEAAGADGFINRMSDGYNTVVGERGYTLSGGQRQRIAIARALLVNPPILILDDATSAIDVKVEQRIHSSLRVLMEGRTTLIIAHRLSTISLADRVVLLDGGQIVADGTHAELLASTPLYSEVLAQAAREETAEVVAAEGREDLGLESEFDGDVLEPEEVDLAPEVGPEVEPEVSK
jgi:ATP-binding cassette subfamily B protein